jgi:hypothetical protein
MRLTYKEFIVQVERLLGGTASGKGYSERADAPLELYDFVAEYVGGNKHGHALGEIIYKTVRFARKGNVEDILKAAAWAFLVAKHFEREKHDPPGPENVKFKQA